jgi:hypothetical protein
VILETKFCQLQDVTLFQDQDVLHSWLMDLHFEEYFPLFASAGYDMPTICRMTPEVSSNYDEHYLGFVTCSVYVLMQTHV